jgi:enhancer of polycomb-like protein
LRKELELARHGLAMVKQREVLKRDILASDRQIFEERMQVKEEKRRSGLKDDDEDLINQKVGVPYSRHTLSIFRL